MDTRQGQWRWLYQSSQMNNGRKQRCAVRSNTRQNWFSGTRAATLAAAGLRTMMESGKQAYLLFDGDCGICSWSAEKVQRMDRRGLFAVQPYQSITAAELQKFGLTYQDCEKKMQVITRAGKVWPGAFGVNYFFWHYWPWKLLVGLIYAIPPVLVAEIIIYAWVARHRHQLSKWFGLKACLLKH